MEPKAWRETHLSMLDKMRAELLEPHLVQRPDRGGSENIGAVQVQEDRADGEHLTGVLFPTPVHLAQEQDLIRCLTPCQLLYLPLRVPIASLHMPPVSGRLPSHTFCRFHALRASPLLG